MNVYGPGQDQHAVYSGVVPIMLNKIALGEAPQTNGDGSQAVTVHGVRELVVLGKCHLPGTSEGRSPPY